MQLSKIMIITALLSPILGNAAPTNNITIDGIVFRNATIRTNGNQVVIQHATGITTISLPAPPPPSLPPAVVKAKNAENQALGWLQDLLTTATKKRAEWLLKVKDQSKSQLDRDEADIHVTEADLEIVRLKMRIERYKKIMTTWGNSEELYGMPRAKLIEAVRSGHIFIGMPADLLYVALGKPEHINTMETATLRREQWCYAEGQGFIKDLFYYVENGIVVSKQE